MHSFIHSVITNASLGAVEQCSAWLRPPFPLATPYGKHHGVPVVSLLVQVLVEVARSLGIKCHARGTMLTIEGPRFSSRAESLMFRQWGADVINMSTVPEVVLAKEAGLCYASIAMATDYDCWKEHEEAVSGVWLF